MTSTFARWSRSLLLALAASLAAGVATSPAEAAPTASDNETARQLLREGIKLREAGSLKEAAEKLKGAHALARTPVTGLELGKTYLMLNQLVEARDVFREVVRLPEDRETDRTRAARADAETKANELSNRIPSLVLKLSGGPDPSRVTVRVDGEVVPAVALSAPRKVNPGKHQVVVEIDGEPRARAEMSVAEGETRDVPLALPNPPPPTKPIGPVQGPQPQQPGIPPPFWSGQRIAGAALGGAGVVGIAVGAAFGAIALGKNSQSNADGHCHDGNVCDSTGFALRHDARSAGTASTVGWVAGGVLLAGGAATFFTASLTGPRSNGNAALVVGPLGIGVRGAW